MQPAQLTGKRDHYIDNLRSISILLLFPVHTFMIWNNFGSGFYVWLEENKIYSTLIVLINPWFMPLLFLLAGISARLSLEKRTTKEFVIQRINKLLIPFIAGMVFLVPIQTLYARKFFYNYSGGFIENWRYFFTHFTDLSGYDGAFTPGHLWFILYLFIISIVSLIIFRYFPYKKIVQVTGKLHISCIILLFIPIWLMYYIGNFGGFSIGKNMALYLAGYYIISNNAVMEKAEKNIKWITLLCLASTLISAVLYYKYLFYGDIWVCYIGWVTILVLLVYGKRFLNKKTKLMEFARHASYPVYILHQSILVALAYYITREFNNIIVQAAVICVGSLILTIMSYYIISKIPVARKIIAQ